MAAFLRFKKDDRLEFQISSGRRSQLGPRLSASLRCFSASFSSRSCSVAKSLSGQDHTKIHNMEMAVTWSGNHAVLLLFLLFLNLLLFLSNIYNPGNKRHRLSDILKSSQSTNPTSEQGGSSVPIALVCFLFFTVPHSSFSWFARSWPVMRLAKRHIMGYWLGRSSMMLATAT